MRTINLSAHATSVTELFDMARKDALLVKTRDGHSFLISVADEFGTEVDLLRHHHSFLSMLDEYKTAQETIPIAQVEKNLR